MNQQQTQQQTNLNQDQDSVMYNYQLIGKSNNSEIYTIIETRQIEGQNVITANKVLKVIRHTNSQHNQQCLDLHNEYAIMKELQHENILSVLTYKQTQGRCQVVMERAKTDLFHLLKQQQVPIQLKKKFFLQTANALKYLHNEKNIAHNDIKLANLFIMGNLSLKVADFGFAQSLNNQEAANQFQRWQNRETTNMAPEFNQKVSTNDQTNLLCEKANDVFAFGVALFQSIFLNNPFTGKAEPEDEKYKLFYQGQQGIMQFWANPELRQKYVQIKNNNQNAQLEYLIDLLTRCFEPKVEDRITIDQICQHPWITNQ